MSEETQTLDPDLVVGSRVGEYEVEGLLGKGAFGTVFKAVHPRIGKVVAIKVLGRKFSVDPEMLSRFEAEARAVNQIRNRHIIDIFSFGALEDGRQYYVMEYLDGEPLDALIEQGRPSITDTLVILRGVAKALDAAHAKGVAHRDLKAENVFLAKDSDAPGSGFFPKLLDFGIAKLMAPEDGLKHKTRTGAPIGTPYYMSPEQCRGKDVDHRTDIYAFGVLAYLMLTGVFPFDAEDYMSILMMQISERQAAPSTHNAELTREIDDAIAWMMNKDPADRPPDLKTAVRALEQACSTAGLAQATKWSLDTGPVAIPTQAINVASVGAGTGRGGQLTGLAGASVPAKRRSRAGLIAAGLAAVLVGGVVYLAIGRSKPEKPTPPAPQKIEIAAPQPPPKPPEPVHVEPPAPQTVKIDIKGVPNGTEVLAGGMTVGAAPGTVELPAGKASTVLTFKVDGYQLFSEEVMPDADKTVTISKKKLVRKGGGGAHSTKNDILDPFAKGK